MCGSLNTLVSQSPRLYPKRQEQSPVPRIPFALFIFAFYFLPPFSLLSYRAPVMNTRSNGDFLFEDQQQVQR